ncbi:MAG: glycosyltransferase family 2 protein [Caulobacteraceae bacterium]|nr:glycosyltransferase family 2 protein [Caulobacteraceae bacterium]
MARAGADGKPLVSVIVVTYRSAGTLPRCLEALRGQTTADFEVILSDNGTDGGAPDAAAADPSIRLIANNENLGFAAGVNRAAARAEGRWLALLNPDAYAAPDWLEKLLAAADAHPDIRCFASRQRMADDLTILDGLGDVMSLTGFAFRGGYGQTDPGPVPEGEVFSACGGAMLIDRELFLSMGGLDEWLFCYCEDVDLGYRLRLRGERTLIVPEAEVAHVGSASSGGPSSEFARFHGTRNRFWVFIKDTPPVLFWLTLPLHLATTVVLFISHLRHGEAAAPWRGFMAGVRGLPEAWRRRKIAQAQRKVSSAEIARAMTWSPIGLWKRRVFIQPLTGPRPDGP